MTTLHKFLYALACGLAIGIGFGLGAHIGQDIEPLTRSAAQQMRAREQAAPLRETKAGACVCPFCNTVVDCERIERQTHKVFLAKKD